MKYISTGGCYSVQKENRALTLKLCGRTSEILQVKGVRYQMTKFEDPFQNHQARYLLVAGVLTKPGQHEGETS